MCLRVTGPLRAMKCPSSEPVSTMVPTPLFSVILERMSSPRLPSTLLALAAQVDLVVCHHADELKDLLPARDEARAQHVVHAEGLGGRGGRRSRVVRCVRKLLAQLQVGRLPSWATLGVFQMAYILPERLLALVRPAFDLVLRRIRSLKRCVQV